TLASGGAKTVGERWPYKKRAVAPCGTTALKAAGGDELLDHFAGLLTPAEAVLRAVQGDHPDAVIGRVAAGRTADDHVIAGLQCLSGDTLAAELAGTAPLNGVA